MAIVRNWIIRIFFQLLIFALILLYYFKRDSNIFNRVTDENVVMSAIRDTTTLTGERLSDCRQLFGSGTSAHNFSMTEDFQSNIAQFLSVVAARTAPNSDGHTYGVKMQYKLFHYLTWKLKFVHTVCETGFNAGHSSFNFLTARRDVIVHSFDIGRHRYVRLMASYLQEKFPGRLKVTLGDSRKTIPRYFTSKNSTLPLTCDLIFVDGGHRSDVPLKDIVNFAQVASQPYNVIFVDDVNGADVRTAWQFAIKSDIVQQLLLTKCSNGGSFTEFAVGMVVQQKKRSQ